MLSKHLEIKSNCNTFNRFHSLYCLKRIADLRIFILIILFEVVFITCEKEKGKKDYSGVYCLNIQNMEMTIIQEGDEITFALQQDLLMNGTGTFKGDTLFMTANTTGQELFTCQITFSEDGQSFSGPYQVKDMDDNIATEGILQGNKGECVDYDIETKGIPKFVEEDFTQLSKIEKISKFRSGIGHSYTDDFETCRSMKHYYTPYENYRENNTVKIYSPVSGTIVTVSNDGHGASIGLNNKQIHIGPDDQPAFTFVIFHCDLASSAITAGKKVQAGELLGYARLYYEDLAEYATSFDIALWVHTPTGMRLIPYFDTMKDVVFNNYISRGALSRQDFKISEEARDADPLECNGESFLTSGQLENWVMLQ
jgi:hypothetical protein